MEVLQISSLKWWPFLPFSSASNQKVKLVNTLASSKGSKTQIQGTRLAVQCSARRRAVHGDDDDDDDEDDNEQYRYNEEIGMLEMYSQSAMNEVLLVHAAVDDREEEVLIFKGFSSCLTYRTSPDPSRSVLPARAVIESIDRIKGPFDPSNIEYLEKGLTWETFKHRIQSNKM